MNSRSKPLSAFQRQQLEKQLETETRPELRRRLEIMLAADDGHSQTEICKMLGCSKETARYWISVAQMGQAHLWNQKSLGRPQKVTDEYRDRLRELVSQSPRSYRYSFQRWTGEWLSRHLAKELGITISARHVNALLKAMGLSTRPQASTVGPDQNTTISIQDLSSRPEATEISLSSDYPLSSP